MSYQNYWFPSQTGSYYTPAGNLRFKIHYDEGAGGDTDTNADVFDLGRLLFPMGDNPSGPEVRLSEWQVEIHNKDNVFENASILDEVYHETDTFITFYLDGNEFWKGLIDFKSIQRDNYRYDDTYGFIYDTIKIRAFDAIKYFWDNGTTLSDISGYSDGMEFEDLIDYIGAEIGFASSNVGIDPGISITSEDGYKYDLDADFFIGGAPSDLKISTLLSHVMAGFVCYIFNLNGNLYITSRAGSISAVTISVNNIIKRKDIRNINKAEYVSLSATKDWSRYCSIDDITYTLGSGDANAVENRIEITDLDSLGYLFIQATSEQSYYSDFLTANGGSDTSMVDNSENFLDPTALKYPLQSGMIFDDDGEDFSTPIHGFDSLYGYTNNVIYFTYGGQPISSPITYKIYRHPKVWADGTRENRVYKIYQILEKATEQFFSFFAHDETINLTVHGIGDFLALHNRYILDGSNYRARYARYDLIKNLVDLKLVPVL